MRIFKKKKRSRLEEWSDSQLPWWARDRMLSIAFGILFFVG